MTLNDYAAEVHAANKKWWVDLQTGQPIERNVGEMLMLVVSELAEAMEGHRKNLMDDHLPHRKMAEVEMADALIRLLDIGGGLGVDITTHYEGDNLTEMCSRAALSCTSIRSFGEYLLQISWEVADLCRRYEIARETIQVGHPIGNILYLCAHMGFDLEGAYRDKMEYNKTRADHQAAARLAPNGKKY